MEYNSFVEVTPEFDHSDAIAVICGGEEEFSRTRAATHNHLSEISVAVSMFASLSDDRFVHTVSRQFIDLRSHIIVKCSKINLHH